MMNINDINFKRIRAQVIAKYVKQNKYDGVVCFSCGNATRELKEQGLNVIDISECGDFVANRWFKQSEIKRIFPNLFDATSGHLPIEVMIMISEEIKKVIRRVPDYTFDLYCGSGETMVCLKMAFPNAKINAIYNRNKATEYNELSPLNKIVELLANKIEKYGEQKRSTTESNPQRGFNARGAEG